MININRNILLQELSEFSKSGHGLVVGDPGVGKSFLLELLKHSYLDDNNLAIVIRIDNLIEGTDEEIQQDLKLTESWIESLKRVKISSGVKALLIFDAFDAARNEILRQRILKQIQRAKNELSEKWNIIASVRTYDAAKSQKLIDLFPITTASNENVYCRKLIIPSLTEEEIIKNIETNTSLLQFYQEGTLALKSILKIPFFLNLADKILPEATPEEIQDLKKMESEAQLLKTFWIKKIMNSEDHLIKEQILLDLTKILVHKRALSCSLNEFIPHFNTQQSTSFEYLRSENIINESISAGRRISFSHNILFDYAVSNLYLEKDVEKILTFIKEEPSRPFFLRPSFVYFFAQLWHDDNDSFWDFFWRLNREDQKEIKLFIRLILTGIIASEFSNVQNLEQIWKFSNLDEQNQIVRNILQSIRFVRKKSASQDISLLEYLSNHLAPVFLWDFAFLLDRAVNNAPGMTNHLKSLGIASRNFLNYALEIRKADFNQSIERLAATRGVEMVCKTYASDQEESRKLLSSLFDLLKEPNFEIYYFFNLSEYISSILEYDPGFVAEVYMQIFNHTERSTEQTSMGGGVTMNLLSNRKQDFELCQYRLVEFFNTFLAKSPMEAIPVGLKAVNKYVISDRGNSFTQVGTEESFNLHGSTRSFITDFSSIWASNGINYDKPAKLATQIIEFIQDRNEAGKEIRGFLDKYLEYAKVAYTWKLVIGLGAKLIDKYTDYFYEFCLVEIFYKSSDTQYELGRLIESAKSAFSSEKIKNIEEVIHSIADNLENRDIEYFKRKFLSRLPENKLSLEVSKTLISKSGKVENEKPYQSTTTVTPYTTRMHLSEMGVDLSDSTNNNLLEESEQLKEFNDRWRNDIPQKEDWEEAIKIAADIFDKISKPGLHEQLVFTMLSDVTQTYAIVSRNITQLDDEDFAKLKSVIFHSYQYLSYNEEASDVEASPSRGYGPTPRIIAAEALAPIASREDSSANLDVLTSAVKHTNAVIRFNAIRLCSLIKNKQPLCFHSLMFDGLREERDAFVASTILENIPAEPYVESEANLLLETCVANGGLFKFNNIFLDNFTLRAIWLYTTYKNEVADKIINEAYKQDQFCRTVVFRVFEDFRISSLKHYSNSEFFIDNSIRWILNYIDKTARIVAGLPKEQLSKESADVKNALDLYDTVIQRIYFTLSRNQFGNRPVIPIGEDNRKDLYQKVKPIFEKLILVSTEFPGGGFIVGHTAHYFIQTLNSVLDYDPKEILSMIVQITRLSIQTMYTFDSFSIREMVSLTEKLLADHRDLLTQTEPFNHLIELLDIYMESGWNEALELLWKLDEIFK